MHKIGARPEAHHQCFECSQRLTIAELLILIIRQIAFLCLLLQCTGPSRCCSLIIAANYCNINIICNESATHSHTLSFHTHSIQDYYSKKTIHLILQVTYSLWNTFYFNYKFHIITSIFTHTCKTNKYQVLAAVGHFYHSIDWNIIKYCCYSIQGVIEIMVLKLLQLRP